MALRLALNWCAFPPHLAAAELHDKLKQTPLPALAKNKGYDPELRTLAAVFDLNTPMLAPATRQALTVEHEQHGNARAEYGTQQLTSLSASLSEEFGKGFDVSNLRNMLRFNLAFPIQDSVRLEEPILAPRFLAFSESPWPSAVCCGPCRRCRRAP